MIRDFSSNRLQILAEFHFFFILFSQNHFILRRIQKAPVINDFVNAWSCLLQLCLKTFPSVPSFFLSFTVRNDKAFCIVIFRWSTDMGFHLNFPFLIQSFS